MTDPITLEIEPVVAAAAPALVVSVVTASVRNTPTPDALWDLITAAGDDLRRDCPIDRVNKIPAIAATRAAYKALGKEPNRYRPSAEALARRCVRGLGLYRSLAIIDLINLMSLRTGHSIGGFDLDRVAGNVLRLGRGCPGEPYEAIGRGLLNIDGLPVIRDATGGIGTPTSDNDRTKLSTDTSRLLMTINMYDGPASADRTEALARQLLSDFAAATDITFRRFAAS